jgi:hypothetical protein
MKLGKVGVSHLMHSRAFLCCYHIYLRLGPPRSLVRRQAGMTLTSARQTVLNDERYKKEKRKEKNGTTYRELRNLEPLAALTQARQPLSSSRAPPLLAPLAREPFGSTAAIPHNRLPTLYESCAGLVLGTLLTHTQARLINATDPRLPPHHT